MAARWRSWTAASSSAPGTAAGPFTGRWRIEESAGVLVLDRDDGKNAQCHYVVTEKTLTLSNCPAQGTYHRG